MRHENLVVRLVVNNKVLFTHTWGCYYYDDDDDDDDVKVSSVFNTEES